MIGKIPIFIFQNFEKFHFLKIFQKKFKKVTFLKFSMEKIKIVKMAKKPKIATNLIKKLEKFCFFLINDQDFS